MTDRLSKQHVILLVYLPTADVIPIHDKFIFTLRHQLENIRSQSFLCMDLCPLSDVCLIYNVAGDDFTSSVRMFYHLHTCPQFQ